MIKIELNSKKLDGFIRKFSRLETLPRQLRSDMYRLGEGCYKYIKNIIPVSKLHKPHLRNNFIIKVYKSAPLSVTLKISPKPEFTYAIFLALGVDIPTRFPRRAKALRFIGYHDKKVVFARRAKGFTFSHVKYVSKGEHWLKKNFKLYIDTTLRRYL